MVDLPELGIGVVYTPSLEPLLEAGKKIITALEIEPQPFWFKTRSPENPYRLDYKIFGQINQYPQPKVIHSVGLPIGGSLPLNEDYLNCLIESVKLAQPAWVSEHLSFNRTRNRRGEFDTGFLLPPLQSHESVEIAAQNINYLRDRLGVSIAFETGVNYLQPIPGEIEDGNFFAAVAQAADCGILLDLHNLWCNEKNGRSSVRKVIQQLPLDRVWEIHLAGGQSWQGYWLDAHSGLVPDPVMKLAAEIIPLLPNLKAIFFELSENYLQTQHFSLDVLLEQMRQIEQLWSLRPSQKVGAGDWRLAKPVRGEQSRSLDSVQSPQVLQQNTGVLPSVSAWETTLGCLIAKQPNHIPPTKKTADDSKLTLSFSDLLGNQDQGIEIVQYLVARMRGGTVVDALKLSTRLLILSLGKANFDKLLTEFWQTTPPELFATEEAINLANYLKARTLNIDHLEEVLDFELAGYQVLIEGLPQKIEFSCEPMSLLTALQGNYLPENIIPGKFEIILEP